MTGVVAPKRSTFAESMIIPLYMPARTPVSGGWNPWERRRPRRQGVRDDRRRCPQTFDIRRIHDNPVVHAGEDAGGPRASRD